ncbi:unnamed protein product [Rotaria magnacalcarata]|uniref:CCHC-type domain-containing protein n=1 Tax=Rotaria magnacalcarata TaxID=392030 RepID=A0A820JQP0_9BILA|nr:unnamed protein product [Rotaria magnacalcarata]CAF4328742.1 unnamed protein product [Rotaria magnacalcarata]
MAGKGDEKDQAIIDLTQRMMKMMDDFNTASGNKVHFKALKPGIYSVDDAISLEDFLTKFEKYCSVKFGTSDEDSWSSALGELLVGDIKNAYTNMSGGNAKYRKLKELLLKRFEIDADRKELFLKQFEVMERLSGESIDDFSLRLEKLARKAFSDFEEKAFNQTLRIKFMSCLTNTLRVGVRAALVREDASKLAFDDLVLLTKKVEINVNIVEVEEVKIKPSPILPLPIGIEAVANSKLSFRPNGEKRQCTHCKREGHLALTCWLLHPEFKKSQSSRNNITVRTCFRCNLPGHLANFCPNNAINYRQGLTIASPQSAGAVAIPIPLVDPPQQINNNLMCIGCGKKGAEFHLINKCPIMISWLNKTATTNTNSSRVATIEQEPLN